MTSPIDWDVYSTNCLSTEWLLPDSAPQLLSDLHWTETESNSFDVLSSRYQSTPNLSHCDCEPAPYKDELIPLRNFQGGVWRGVMPIFYFSHYPGSWAHASRFYKRMVGIRLGFPVWDRIARTFQNGTLMSKAVLLSHHPRTLESLLVIMMPKQGRTVGHLGQPKSELDIVDSGHWPQTSSNHHRQDQEPGVFFCQSPV